jgi:hypothetical protein
MKRKRRYLLQVRGVGEVSVWAETRHKAKAEVARKLIEHGQVGDFKEACRFYIPNCWLAPEEPGARAAVWMSEVWGAGAQGAKESLLRDIFEVMREEVDRAYGESYSP